MDKLTAVSPFDGLKLGTIGRATLRELAPEGLWSIAPFKGCADQVGALLPADLPKPGRSLSSADGDVLWFAQNHVMLLAAAAPAGLQGLAAVTDQSDAWCLLDLSGPDAEAVLARLVAVDLREKVFQRGYTLRASLGHIRLHLTRIGPDQFRLMCFRSMAGSMVHDLTRVMGILSARG